MGYNIREGVVEQHAEHLETILQGLSKNQAISFDCTHLADMNKMKYQFLRILKATDMLPHECGGRYHGLRAQVRVREDWRNMAVVIEPVHVPYRVDGILSSIPSMPNEHDVLEQLKQFEGQMDLVHFTPTSTFNVNTWQVQLLRIGFDLVADPDAAGWIGGVNDEGNKAEYAVARVKDSKPTGFGLLNYNPSGDMSERG
jgi:hypothetical protein